GEEHGRGARKIRAARRSQRLDRPTSGAVDDRPRRDGQRHSGHAGGVGVITLDGHSLTIDQLVAIARDGEPVRRHPSTDARVAASEAIIARAVERYTKAWEAGEPAPTEYGV